MENCKYWTQQDILHIYKHQNDDPYSLDSLALRASMWGSGMSQNYHPVKFIPKEVKLVDGKFYVWTEKWKWVEVPFSHDVLWDQKRELGRVDDGDWEQYLGPYAINKEINENMKNTIKLNETQLRSIVAESVRRVLREQIDNSLSLEELKHLVTLLKRKPLQDMWNPVDCGFCKVQRVEANNMSGKCSLLNRNDDGTDDLYKEGINGITLVQIGRKPNTHRLEDSGYTYMAWKD